VTDGTVERLYIFIAVLDWKMGYLYGEINGITCNSTKATNFQESNEVIIRHRTACLWRQLVLGETNGEEGGQLPITQISAVEIQFKRFYFIPSTHAEREKVVINQKFIKISQSFFCSVTWTLLDHYISFSSLSVLNSEFITVILELIKFIVKYESRLHMKLVESENCSLKLASVAYVKFRQHGRMDFN